MNRPYLTYYCEICDKYHHGERGVCLQCGRGNRIPGFNINPWKTNKILTEYPTEEDFVKRCLLKGKGDFYKEWTNEEVMRIFYKRCQMKKEPTIEEVKAFYDEEHTKHQSRWLNRPNPRIQALKDFAHNQMIKRIPGTLLDLGCGVGILTKELSKLVHRVTAVDLSDSNIETAREHNSSDNITYLAGDFTHMLLTEAFDMICMFDVVEHIRPSDREAFLLNAHRHCGRVALVSIPDPKIILKYRKTRPEDLQIVDEPVYDDDFSMFTIQQKITAGKYIYYILTP